MTGLNILISVSRSVIGNQTAWSQEHLKHPWSLFWNTPHDTLNWPELKPIRRVKSRAPLTVVWDDYPAQPEERSPMTMAQRILNMSASIRSWAHRLTFATLITVG